MGKFEFQYPLILLILLLIPAMQIWYFAHGKNRDASFRYSNVSIIPQSAIRRGKWKIIFLTSMRSMMYAFIIIALSRPQLHNTVGTSNTEIIDILLVIDQSSSMLAQDFEPNRLGAVKQVAKEFVLKREGDRLGLVVFAGQSFIQCPLTTDINVVASFVDSIQIVEKEFDGTAIGMGIANAINRLRDSETKSKVMILLSDGSNNQGELDPLTAADLASKFDIRIYAIAAGTRGVAPYPVQDMFGRTVLQNVEVDVDEETLKEIAKITGGRFYRATDNASLSQIYDEINQLERTKVEVTEYTNVIELYNWFTIPASILAVLILIFSRIVFRKLI